MHEKVQIKKVEKHTEILFLIRNITRVSLSIENVIQDVKDKKEQ